MDHDKWTPDETSQDKWTAVDRYFSEQLSLSDPALDAALAANKAAELPAIDVAPNQGKFLQLLALLVGARSILEIGTLGGYSSIWLARALPAGGRLITLEFNRACQHRACRSHRHRRHSCRRGARYAPKTSNRNHGTL